MVVVSPLRSRRAGARRSGQYPDLPLGTVRWSARTGPRSRSGRSARCGPVDSVVGRFSAGPSFGVVLGRLHRGDRGRHEVDLDAFGDLQQHVVVVDLDDGAPDAAAGHDLGAGPERPEDGRPWPPADAGTVGSRGARRRRRAGRTAATMPVSSSCSSDDGDGPRESTRRRSRARIVRRVGGEESDVQLSARARRGEPEVRPGGRCGDPARGGCGRAAPPARGRARRPPRRSRAPRPRRRRAWTARPGRRRSGGTGRRAPPRSSRSRPQVVDLVDSASAAAAAAQVDDAVGLAPGRSRGPGAAAGWRCGGCPGSGRRSRRRRRASSVTSSRPAERSSTPLELGGGVEVEVGR